MTFDHAKCRRMPFGKFKSKTLDEIARTNEGLRYLDWLIGQEWLKGDLKSCVGTFLTDPSMSKEVEQAMQRGGE